jgi:3-phenylpropionate/trans-cinnamate dioxygenase ferredoxin subunit
MQDEVVASEKVPEIPTAIKAGEIAPGQMAAIDVHGVVITIANVGGRFYAVGDACPYDGSSLSQGSLDGMVVTCRNDGSQFDLASGHVLTGPALVRVRTYRVQVRGDDLMI